ncbi:MAG: hypothetical protein ABW185_03045 [Sedimenticola sp.]
MDNVQVGATANLIVIAESENCGIQGARHQLWGLVAHWSAGDFDQSPPGECGFCALF